MRLLLPEARELTGADLLDLYEHDESTRLRGGFILSLDGGIALDGTSRGLQTPADQAAFRTLRGVCDAVLVGAGTARTEGYGPVRLRADAAAWRADHGLLPRPSLVVVSRSLDLPDSVRAPGTVVVTCAASDPGVRADLPDVIVAGDGEIDLVTAVEALHARGLTRLLCEGGPALLTGLLRAGLVGELCLTHAPLLLGSAPGLLGELDAPVPVRLRTLVDGGDGSLLSRWSVG